MNKELEKIKYDFIKEQARLNGNELLQFIEGKIDE